MTTREPEPETVTVGAVMDGAGTGDRCDGLPADLVVDLDGTLLLTDLLYESLAVLLRTRPWALINLVLALFRGKAFFKRRLAQLAVPEVGVLPVNQDLLDWLSFQKRRGRRLHLYSASDQLIVEAVADRFGIFDSAVGSDGKVNLAGVSKLQAIREQVGPFFAYAGNSRADVPLLRAAASGLLVGNPAWLRTHVGPRLDPRSGTAKNWVEAEFPVPPPSVGTWLKAMRVHQWAKNTLVFVPILLSSHVFDLHHMAMVVVGFLAFSLLASTTYLFNDLMDLPDDRRHPTQSRRPLASGALPIAAALLSTPLFAGAIVMTATAVPSKFVGGLLVYLVLTAAYSVRLKRVPILDILILAFLFTLRILCGMLLIEEELSPWLLTFSMFFFFSLAAVKRYSEWLRLAKGDADGILRRGYQIEDGPWLMAIGAASAFCSSLVFFIYLVDNRYPSQVYRDPAWLWLVCIILAYWLARCWLFTVRGQMTDDPIMFAITDRLSLFLAGLTGTLFLLVRI